MSVRAWGFAGLIAVLALLAFGLVSEGSPTLEQGDSAPGAADELERLDGRGEGSIADYSGRWVLVNFWASWCGPCREEAPVLEAFWRRHRERGVVVLGIDLDDATDDARRFVDEFDLTYPQLRDGDGRDRREAWGMTGFPESFLIDPDGRVALLQRGPVDAEILRRELEPLIEAR